MKREEFFEQLSLHCFETELKSKMSFILLTHNTIVICIYLSRCTHRVRISDTISRLSVDAQVDML